MEWINTDTLQLLTLAILLAAMWSRSYSAMCYAFLIIVHDQLFQSLAETNGAAWAFSAGIFSALSFAGCYYFKNGPNDKVAFNLAMLSLGWLAVNIGTISSWINYLPTEVLNPIFAIMNIASIWVIFEGGKSEFDRTKLLYRHIMAFRISRERANTPNNVAKGIRR